MKKILIADQIFDKTIVYQPFYKGETFGGKVVEIEDKFYYDCVREDFDKNYNFDIVKYNQRKNNEVKEQELQQELNSLYEWFNEYDNQIKQYERCQRLGIEFDKNIEKLDNQATINQKRIAEIRQILNVHN